MGCVCRYFIPQNRAACGSCGNTQAEALLTELRDAVASKDTEQIEAAMAKVEQVVPFYNEIRGV